MATFATLVFTPSPIENLANTLWLKIFIFLPFSGLWFYVHYTIVSNQQLKVLAVLKMFTFQELRSEFTSGRFTSKKKINEKPCTKKLIKERDRSFKYIMQHFYPCNRFFERPKNELENYPHFIGSRVVKNLKEHKKFQNREPEQVVYPVFSILMWVVVLFKVFVVFP